MTTFTTTTTTDTKQSADSLNETADVTITEYLSALLDDEVGSFEQKRVLNELSNNDEMRNKLASYSLIGETLRSGKSALLTTTASATTSSFLSGIQDQLADEPTYSEVVLQNNSQQTTKAKNDSSWLRPVGGFAMAASVAALAVIGFQNYFMPSNSVPTNNGLSQPTEIVAANSIIAPSKMIENPVSTATNTDTIIKDKLTEAEMASAMVVTADQLQNKDAQSADATTYLKADLQTRSLLKRYVDSHMQYASTTTFVPSVRVIAYSDY